MKAEQLVEKVLKDYPETRASDTLLYFKCLELQGVKFPEELVRQVDRIGINPETARRVRQKLQNNQAKYLPSPDVVKERLYKQAEMTLWASKNKKPNGTK